ncbi:hypothetical protein N8603_03075 [Verrucomicrobiales bacterium]|nr:hypothetical protein [Verrucomicrobiales bacterium]
MNSKSITKLIIFTIILNGCSNKDDAVPKNQNVEVIINEPTNVTVNGSVFIKTEGAENYKLSLIRIGVSTIDDYKLACLNNLKALDEIINRSFGDIEKIQMSISERNFYLHRLDITLNHIKKIVKSWTVKSPFIKVNLLSGDIEWDKAIGGDKKTIEDKIKILNVYIDEYNNYLKRHSSLSKQQPIDLSEASFLEEEFDKRTRSVIKSLHNSSKKLTRSDADGKFSLKLEQDKNYIISGYGQRKIGETTEMYNWIIPIGNSKQEENENQTTSSDILTSGFNILDTKEIDVFLSNDELTKNIHGDEKISQKINEIRSLNVIPKNLKRVPDISTGVVLSQFNVFPRVKLLKN